MRTAEAPPNGNLKTVCLRDGKSHRTTTIPRNSQPHRQSQLPPRHPTARRPVHTPPSPVLPSHSLRPEAPTARIPAINPIGLLGFTWIWLDLPGFAWTRCNSHRPSRVPEYRATNSMWQRRLAAVPYAHPISIQ